MAWPSPVDFRDAVQTPRQCFETEDLAQGTTAVTPMGMPLVYSGNFACVFKVTTGGGDVAVRCFTREVGDQQERYGHLSDYLKGVKPEAFVGFEYVERGIRVKGHWYPIVRMDWAEGDRLDKFVADHIDRPDAFLDLAARWRGVNGTLRGLKIAHNDLQHGNVMVQEQGALRLVDYDGIFLPGFDGQPSPEVGHRHYQHPMRSSQDYHAGIDNFPSLVVYLSLLALSAAPDLWDRFYNQDNILFTRGDFADPNNSECFKALRNIQGANVAELSDYLAELCSLPVEQVPDLESILLHGSSTHAGDRPAIGALPAPDAHTGTPPPLVTESGYRRLLQTQQASAPVPPPPPAPVMPDQSNAHDQLAVSPPISNPGPNVPCPKCRRTNSSEFIYCASQECLTVLLPGRQNCDACRSAIPVNAVFCPECGVKLTALTKP